MPIAYLAGPAARMPQPPETPRRGGNAIPSAREAIVTPRHKRQSSGSRREDILVTSRGPVRIRPALLSDSSSFRALRLEALKNHPEAFAAAYESEAAEPDEYWVRRLPREEADSTGALYFAESAEALVGMAGIAPWDPSLGATWAGPQT